MKESISFLSFIKEKEKEDISDHCLFNEIASSFSFINERKRNVRTSADLLKRKRVTVFLFFYLTVTQKLSFQRDSQSRSSFSSDLHLTVLALFFDLLLNARTGRRSKENQSRLITQLVLFSYYYASWDNIQS